MSQFQEKLETFKADNSKLSLGLSEELLEKVAKGLGPSLYNADASTVACSDADELDRVKKNFLMKKLGLDDSPELDAALKEVCEKLGSSNRNKHRALFYALLVVKFGKEDVYS